MSAKTETFLTTLGTSDWSGRVARGGNASLPVILAIHGGTYDSRYFDVPGHSVIDRAVAKGFDIVAVDRPGYGKSTAVDDAPDMIQKHADALNAAVPSLMASLGLGGRPVFVIGHSIGGAGALTLVSQASGWTPTGIAISGVGLITPPESAEAYAHLPPIYFVELPTPMKDQIMFGPTDTHPADMPQASHVANTHVPRSELLDVTGGWLDRVSGVLARITVPVHYRQGEHEKLWINNDGLIADFAAKLVKSPRVDSGMVATAGHCIEFHNAGPAFVDSQLAFAAQTAN